VTAPELKVVRVSLGNVLDYCALSLEAMAALPLPAGGAPPVAAAAATE
jgi:hypothetical protein